MAPDALVDALEPVLAAWTIGGGAADKAPTGWVDAIGAAGGERELGLLALAGGLLGPFVVPAPPGALLVLADLPRLALPTLAERLRPLARRALAALGDQAGHARLAALLAARDVVLHPGDWLPPATDTEPLPVVYAPWQDWVAAAGHEAGARDRPEMLTADTWDDYGSVARVCAFAALRHADPAAARALIAARGASGGVEQRLRLVASLAHGLSQADVPYLESLATDRAARVKALAASLLARLGHGGSDDDVARELAALFKLETKGLLRRTRVLTPVALKTPAQHNRRRELLSIVPAQALAAAIGLPTPGDLAVLWPLGADARADGEFAQMLAASADDAALGAFVARVVAERAFDPFVAVALAPRLPDAARAALARAALGGDGGFGRALMVAPVPGTLDALMATPAGEALIVAVAGGKGDARECAALGLLASASAAAEAIARLTDAGMLPSDPRLDVLRLNRATGAARGEQA